MHIIIVNDFSRGDLQVPHTIGDITRAEYPCIHSKGGDNIWGCSELSLEAPPFDGDFTPKLCL